MLCLQLGGRPTSRRLVMAVQHTLVRYTLTVDVVIAITRMFVSALHEPTRCSVASVRPCDVTISLGDTGCWSGVVVSALASISEVNQRRARLVLRWATVSGFNSRCRTFISVCNQKATQGQLSLPSPGSVNEYQLRLRRQRQVWFIPLADERGVRRYNCGIP